MSERRNSKRKRVVLEARWESMSRRHQARVDDVSLGGCFVNTYGPVELNEPVSLQILLPAGVWLNLRGTVVTYQPGVGFGISFRSLTEDEETSLKELIASAIERTL
ncbi:MAG TPA: PilZ domain-containing protein [Pyrinomonadaceae bacterium]|nr:PilZ domain-containing protein [Pyrinomonadaceae bacterium]